jgi:hypothetical protein
MILNLPNEIQRALHDCGDAAVKCVLGHHRVVGAVSLSTPTDGTDPRQIEQAFRQLRMPCVSGEMSVADLRHFCDHSRPVICLVHWPRENDSHYVVARGVSRRWVYYHDVYHGPGKTREAEWLEAWRASGRMAEAFRHWGIAAGPPR